jgi:RNA polymerase sigma-70 factor (ECF subfamily)
MPDLPSKRIGFTLNNPHHLSDAELIERAQSTNSSGAGAISELYDRYQNKIFRYLWSHLPDRETAEDLTGEVFTRMVASLPKYQIGQVPFQAWLYRIAHNLWIDYYRKNRQQNEISLDHEVQLGTRTDDPENMIEGQLFVEQARQGLQNLHPAEQDVIILRFFTGLSLQETALALGKTIGTIKITQHRGLSKLRVVLKNRFVEEN